jgi:hypothetical protein
MQARTASAHSSGAPLKAAAGRAPVVMLQTGREFHCQDIASTSEKVELMMSKNLDFHQSHTSPILWLMGVSDLKSQFLPRFHPTLGHLNLSKKADLRWP